MSLTYIFGGAGCGKTELCYKEIGKLTSTVKNIIYIVPEQFTLESEKSLCLRASGKTLIVPQVLSFGRLGFRLFAECGAENGKIIDDASKNMLLRKISLELAQELPFFGKSIDKQGFIDQLQATIREFFQYDVSLTKLLQLATNANDKLEGKENLRLKMLDLYKFYKRYIEYMQNKYIASDQALNFVPEKIVQSELLNGAHVFIDGFNGFTPQEYKIISKLMEKVESVTVALTIKSDKTNHEQIKDTDPFYEIKKTTNTLTQLAKETQTEIKTPIYLMDAPRFKSFEEMEFFEKNFFIYHQNTFTQPTENLEIYALANRHEEISQAAINILNMTREKGYKYSEIAVVSGNSAEYEKIIKSVFKQYDIPFFIDTKADILSHPLTELIRSCVNIVAYNYTYEAVFNFLKTGFTSFTKDETDMLENYVLAYGIKGYKWQIERWAHGFESGVYDIDTINGLKDVLNESVLPLSQLMKNAKKATVKQFAVAIFTIINNLKVPQKLETMANVATETGDINSARQHAQILSKITTFFDKMVEILGDEPMTTGGFAKLIEAGFKATDMGLIPPCGEQVIIGDIERSRLPAIKALLLVGINEGVLPTPKVETGLFADSEREFLNVQGVELAPDSRKKSYSDQLNIYLTVAKPSERLILSYCKGTFSGKAMRVASLIGKVKRLFPNLEEQGFSESDFVTTPKAMFAQMGQVLRNYSSGGELSEFERGVYKWFKNSGDYKTKLETMETLRFKQKSHIFLSEISIQNIYKREIVTGISRLEQFMKCPFSYFVANDLKAHDRAIYEATNLDFGNFFHNLLEMFSNILQGANVSFKDITAEQIDAIVDDCVQTLAPALSSEVMLSTAHFRHLLERMKRISKKSIFALTKHLQSGVFEPFGFEVSFGIDTPLTSIVVAINDQQQFKLSGKIDRVDVADVDGNTYVKVIDYKSGNVKFSVDDLFFGTQLQLFMYLDAFIKNGKEHFGTEKIKGELLPGGVFYFNINDPIIQTDAETTKEVVDEMMIKSFKMSGIALKDEKLIRAMDKSIDGHSSVLPVYLSKNGFGSKSNAVSLANFNFLRKHVESKVAQIGKEMVAGNINIYPFKKEATGETGCDYCNFRSICQIDIIEGSDKFNLVQKAQIPQDEN